MEKDGVFVATTFLHPLERISELSGYNPNVARGVDLGIEIGRQINRRNTSIGIGNLEGSQGLINYWREADLKALMEGVGFVEYESIRSGQYIMVKAVKKS